MQQEWSCDKSPSGRLVVVELDLLDYDILLFNCVVPQVYYTLVPTGGVEGHCPPTGVEGLAGFRGKRT